MNLSEIFTTSEYLDITSLEDAQQHSLNIGFLYDPAENGSYQKPENLLYIFLSPYGDELFLVLDGTGKNLADFCSHWDKKLLTFCNFSSPNASDLPAFTYNMVQIILLPKTDCEDHNDSIEFSLETSRKIILPFHYDAEGIAIEDDDALEIPFYMESLETVQSDSSLLESLNTYTPSEGDLCYSILSKTPARSSVSHTKKFNFSDTDFNNIKDWLTNHDSSIYKN